jgi:hypothetical protein
MNRFEMDVLKNEIEFYSDNIVYYKDKLLDENFDKEKAEDMAATFAAQIWSYVFSQDNDTLSG